MTKKKTREEYVTELAIKNPTIEVVGEYINANTKITHHCLIHDIYWDTTPSRALQGVGCSICHSEKIAMTKYKSNEQYVEELKNISPHIIVMEPYAEARIPILYKCTIHNVEWMAYPNNMLRGCGCCKCGNEKQHYKKCKSHEQYIEELKIANKNIIAVDTYVGSLIPIMHKCLIDGYEWYASPANILFGTGCPKCNKSRGEKCIEKWLDEHCISYEAQKIFDDCKDMRALPFDFYLNDYNVAIEYDGEQHYRPVEYFGGKEKFDLTVKHDRIKDDYCNVNGIRLLRIPYFKNVENELNNFLFI